MSAGYDGRTIVWDIWEGKPIRVYETGPFKLVDGKFSPDGTSIILSDDVGQLYVLSTGQGEWLGDAKYDQFFLGDYRPLIQDSHGNIVDQETQLMPYRRNMQDLLCDSSMIPYPEPYQSMYQQRRLGTLGIEWRPPSVRLAVGLDFTSDQDYQIPPLADLDILIDPLPDFADAMEWEPEIEVQSDDSDSEFNITEISAEEDAGGLSSSTIGDSDGNEEDSGPDDDHKDGLRRSKRKKQKREIEITTSSGRRVKRRNLDEYDEISHRINETQKSRSKGKALKKSLSSKSSRPQRAAARNALNFFSRITGGTSLDVEDEDGLEDDLSGSESMLQNSSFETEESDRSAIGEQTKHSKGKGIIFDESDDGDRPLNSHESYKHAGNRKRLVLKLSVRDTNKILISDNSAVKLENDMDLEASSSKANSSSPIGAHDSNSRLQDAGHLSGGRNLNANETAALEQSKTGKTMWDLSEIYGNPNIKWGGVRARSSKRTRFGERMALNVHARYSGISNCQNDSNVVHLTPEQECGSTVGNYKDELGEAVNRNHMVTSSLESPSGTSHDKHYSPYRLMDFDDECKRFSNSPPELEIRSNSLDQEDGGCVASRKGVSNLEDKCNSEVPEVAPGNNKAGASDADVFGEPPDIPVQKDDRMFRAVYRRSKSSRLRTMYMTDSIVSNDITFNGGSENPNGGTVANHATPGGIRNHSPRLNGSIPDSDSPVNRSLDMSEKEDNVHLNDQPFSREWGSRTVGLRSIRNRRVKFVRDTSPIDRKKSNHSQRKSSWLMLSAHEGSRYIPQQGDQVVYLRQGHQEYIDSSHSSERGPWEYLKCDIQAVEFCKVVDLDYSTLPGSGDSCCKMKLEFIDSSSSACSKTFKLTLPEVISFPDFLVERTRYEAAVQRNWTARDKCQVWWKNEGEEDGSWWEGRILSVKAKSADFPDSPWERYVIRYKSEPGETHSHSPWELYDASTQWEQPHIDDPTRKKLLSSLTKLQQSRNRAKVSKPCISWALCCSKISLTNTFDEKFQDIYAVQKLKQVSDKSNFLNRFPVPLSIDVIQARLENNYYRSLEAVKHDVKVMVSNAETYFGKNLELSVKVKRLANWFNRTLSSV
ncbi:hypothetical protein Dimus_000816 [Dionaea muscipula]